MWGTASRLEWDGCGESVTGRVVMARGAGKKRKKRRNMTAKRGSTSPHKRLHQRRQASTKPEGHNIS